MTIKLGEVHLQNPFVQAPMVGVTDAPFRTIARRFHKGLLFTEMVSAEAMLRGNQQTLLSTRVDDDHHPIAFQLVGSTPDRMVEAARMAESEGADIIDINAGCPDKRLIATGAGGALVRDVPRLRRIVSAVVRAVDVPVSVKMRLGWDGDISLHLVRSLEGTGASFLTFNGYLVTQGYRGGCDVNALASIVEASPLPVVVNGGIRDEKDAVELLKATGAAGAMIGRATRGRPDMPGTAFELMKEGGFERMGPEVLERTILDHAALEVALYGERRAIRRMRKHVHWYLAPVKRSYRPVEVTGLDTLKQLDALVKRCLEP